MKTTSYTPFRLYVCQVVMLEEANSVSGSNKNPGIYKGSYFIRDVYI